MSSACLLCDGVTRLILDLGATPLANELPAARNAEQERFPLLLVQCTKCMHLQLSQASLVPRERLYRDYVYVSDTGESNRKHFRAYAEEMERRFAPKRVVDIGGNDGLFLSNFNPDASRINVEPAANVAELARDRGILTLEGFFGEDTQLEGKADLITANNVFAHNINLSPMLRGVRRWLSPKGSFVLEVAYGLPMLRDGLFDLIYHEHMHHWLIAPLWRYLKGHELEPYDCEIVPTHGGSLRLYVAHAKAGFKASAELKLRFLEEKSFAQDLVEAFPARVEAGRKAVRAVVDKARGNMGWLHVLGWPAKACTLVNYYGLDKDIGRVFDDNALKVGRCTQFGKRIEPMKDLAPCPEDRLLISSWNYATDIMRRLPQHKGKFIVPLPNCVAQ